MAIIRHGRGSSRSSNREVHYVSFRRSTIYVHDCHGTCYRYCLGAFAGAAARVSKADEIALKEAIVACKAEAKGKKMGWLAGRKYVNKCVAEALKGRPNINVNQLLKGPSGYERGEMGFDLA